MASTSASESSRLNRPPVVQPGSGSTIVINPCQRLNPLLECIRNVGKEFGDIVPDFKLGKTTCSLYLSLKYHRLHPEYIHQRITKLGNAFTLRLLILMCDISEHQDPIRELTKICLINNITIIVCWSNEEAGMYLSTYKAFEHKPPDLIKERVDKEYGAMLRSALTSISKVNKTDVETLRTTFGSFAKIANAKPEELRNLPGFGAVKVRRIVDAFEKPFRNKATSAVPASQVARSALGDDVEGEDDVGENNENERPRSSTESNIPSASHIHQYGSAADSGTIVTKLSDNTNFPSSRRVREPSPTWDIELDLNADDIAAVSIAELDVGPKKKDAGLDARLAKKDANAAVNGGRALASPEDERSSKRPRRSPSPVWDIELDLN